MRYAKVRRPLGTETSEPRYTTQRMIGAAMDTRPSVSIWMYSLKVLSSRGFALFLAVFDGIISYKGLRNWGCPVAESLVISIFIAIFQAAIGLAISSGQPIGARFQARFFEDSGVIGFLKRVLGVFIILFIISVYIGDIASNFASFMGAEFQLVTVGDAVRALFMLIFAIGLALGDEILNLFSDEIEAGFQANKIIRQGQLYEADLTARYQSHYLKAAKPQADTLGAEHGSRWRPTDQ